MGVASCTLTVAMDFWSASGTTEPAPSDRDEVGRGTVGVSRGSCGLVSTYQEAGRWMVELEEEKRRRP
jgi:hypothetical protein